MPKKKKRKILFRIWSGTPVHASIDTRLHMRLVEDLKGEPNADASWEEDFSIITLYNKNGKKKLAMVTHHGRTGYRYPYTPAQTDIEALIMAMHSGRLPKGIKMFVTAHRHKTKGTMEHEGIDIVRCPCFVSFIPYKGSLTMLPHFQPDIGAWIVIISKTGRIKLQEWLYPPFLFHYPKNEIIESKDSEKSYVNPKIKTIEEPLISLLKNAERVILILADTHVGELQAVCPPSFVDVNGFERPINRTKANIKLYEYWQHLCYMTKCWFKPNEIWVVGDCFAGQMPAKFEKFRRITIGNIDDQKCAALTLLKELL